MWSRYISKLAIAGGTVIEAVTVVCVGNQIIEPVVLEVFFRDSIVEGDLRRRLRARGVCVFSGERGLPVGVTCVSVVGPGQARIAVVLPRARHWSGIVRPFFRWSEVICTNEIAHHIVLEAGVLQRELLCRGCVGSWGHVGSRCARPEGWWGAVEYEGAAT